RVCPNRGEYIECTGTFFDFKPHIRQTIIYIVPSLDIFLVHLRRYMQLVLQCLDGRVLARKARTYRVIEMNGCDFFHYRPVAGDVADPPRSEEHTSELQ